VTGQYTRIFPRYLELHGCTMASGNATRPCNSSYLGKIFLYIDHNHMKYLYNKPWSTKKKSKDRGTQTDKKDLEG